MFAAFHNQSPLITMIGSIVEQLYSTANDLQTTNNLQNGPQMIPIIHSTIRINVHVGKMHKRYGLDA